MKIISVDELIQGWTDEEKEHLGPLIEECRLREVKIKEASRRSRVELARIEENLGKATKTLNIIRTVLDDRIGELASAIYEITKRKGGQEGTAQERKDEDHDKKRKKAMDIENENQMAEIQDMVHFASYIVLGNDSHGLGAIKFLAAKFKVVKLQGRHHEETVCHHHFAFKYGVSRYVLVERKSMIIKAYPSPKSDFKFQADGAYPYPIPY